jgi:hypothetical protein
MGKTKDYGHWHWPAYVDPAAEELTVRRHRHAVETLSPQHSHSFENLGLVAQWVAKRAYKTNSPTKGL